MALHEVPGVGMTLRAQHRHHGDETYATDADLPVAWRDVAFHNGRVQQLHDTFKQLRSAHHSARRAVTADGNPVLRQGKGTDCKNCELVAELFFLLAQNEPMLNSTAGALLRMECQKTFHNSSTLMEMCDEVADVLVKLVHSGLAELAELQTDFKEIACADFLSYCVKPCCDTPFAPEQVRLSFGSSVAVGPSTDMNVAWVTLEQTPGVVVEWWPTNASRDATSQSNNATWRTYTNGGWIGVIHLSSMTSLLPDTNYSYHVGSIAYGWSRVFTFRTLPLNIGTAERPMRVIGIADMGYAANAIDTIRDLTTVVLNNEADFIVHPGDIGYADGNQAWWDVFGREMESITSHVPYMTTIGNHEIIFWNGTAYKQRWYMPEAGNGAPSDATFYHFNAGPVSFMMLDTETPIDTGDFGDVQLDWLRQRLVEARGNGQFIFAAHHRPFYCSARTSVDCNTFAQVLRSQAEAMYKNYSVGVSMCGHIHNYERTFPVYNNRTSTQSYDNPPTPFYLVNGAAGNREGQASFESTTDDWSAKRLMNIGYMMFTLSRNASTDVMDMEFIASGSREVLDAVTLTKSVVFSV